MGYYLITSFAVLVCLINLADMRAHHGHKVHSLLLYPDKHAWCETKDIRMEITHPGCQDTTFQNKVCVGQCFSYATPRTNPPNKMEEKLKYCDQCKPSNTTWIKVTLNCDDNTDVKTFTKEVELIHECKCQSCNLEELQENKTSLNDIDDLEYNPDAEQENENIGYGVDANGNPMTREQYLELAREQLESEDEGVLGSKEELERTNGKDWLAGKNYRNMERRMR